MFDSQSRAREVHQDAMAHVRHMSDEMGKVARVTDDLVDICRRKAPIERDARRMATGKNEREREDNAAEILNQTEGYIALLELERHARTVRADHEAQVAFHKYAARAHIALLGVYGSGETR